MEIDALRSIRNSYYLGFYNECSNECQELLNDSHSDISKYANIYYYRSLVHMNPQQVIISIKSNYSISLLLDIKIKIALD